MFVKPIEPGQEPKKKSVWYHIWWFIRGDMSTKKSIWRAFRLRKVKVKQPYVSYQTTDLNDDLLS